MKTKSLGETKAARRAAKASNAQRKLGGRPGAGGVSVSTVGAENFKKKRRQILNKADGNNAYLNRKSQENLK